MSKRNLLLSIKFIHTILWAIIVFFIGYIWYAAIFNKINYLVWISIVVVSAESIILFTNKGRCPLTNFAYTLTKYHEPGFDIYLPKWLAKHNIPLFMVLSILGAVLVGLRIIIK